MKTKIIVEIETKDKYDVLPEEGETEEDYKNKKDELRKFREEYAKGIHKSIIDYIKNVLGDGLEESFMDSSYFEEYYIDSWDEFDDYGIKVKLTT